MDLLMRERAELRSELDSTADQIGQLQTTIANNTHMDAVHLYHPTSREQPQTQSLSKLREDLVQALRDNELLRQAIGKGISSDLQSGVGHRTVSSTQLASAARPGLSAQQRWEVQDMVRRQENLRRSQTDAFEEQIKTLKRDRQEAEQKLTLAESRLSEATADLARLEEMRLKDNRVAAADLQRWKQDKDALTARINELVTSQTNGTGITFPSGHGFIQEASWRPDEAIFWQGSLDAKRDVHENSDESTIEQLRSKLRDVRHETDRQVLQAVEVDQEAYHWFLQTNQSAVSSRESLCAEVALLHTHIATSDHDRSSGGKVEILMENLALLLQGSLFQRQARLPFVAWARVAANSTHMRKIFDHLSRGLHCKGATHNVMISLAARIRDDSSVDVFKVVMGLMLRMFRRPPFRAPFLAWASAARRNRLLWSRATRLVFSIVNGKLRRIVRLWSKLCSIRRRHVDLIYRRTSVISFRTAQLVFRVWSHEVRDASKIFIFGRRTGHSQRRSNLLQHVLLWQQRVKNLKAIKHGWHSLKSRRLIKVLWKPFKCWLVIAMPDISRSFDPGLSSVMSSGRQIWSLDLTAHVARLSVYRFQRKQLRRNEQLCCKKRLHGCVKRSARIWMQMTRDSSVMRRFTCARLVRARLQTSKNAFRIWALQHPRRVNALRIIPCAEESQHHHVSESGHVDRSVAHEMHSEILLESMMPVKLEQVPGPRAAEHQDQHVYFIWKNVIAHFQGRVTSQSNTRLYRHTFGGWIAYQARRSNMHRNLALFQLRWCLAPIRMICAQWRAWTCNIRCGRRVLAKQIKQLYTALLLDAILRWKGLHILRVKYCRHVRVTENKIAQQKVQLITEVAHQWTRWCSKRRRLVCAAARLETRTRRHCLRKAFLHFLIGVDPRSDAPLMMRSWTRSIVHQSAREHFAFDVIHANSEAAHSNHVLLQAFLFWFQLTQRRVAIMGQCHYRIRIRPLRRVFRTWSHFARYKRQTVPKFQRCVQRFIRTSLRLVLDFWRAYAAICCILAHRARKFLAARQGRRYRFLLQFWRVYSASRLRLAQRAAKLVDLGEAKHAKTLTCNATQFWNMYAHVRILVRAKLGRALLSRQRDCKISILLEWIHFVKHNQTVVRFARRYGITKAYAVWAAISKETATLARKGIVLLHQCEIRMRRRAFTALCHRMVAAEIAWQYKSSLKQMEMGSCAGHALRIWVRFVQNCKEQTSFQLSFNRQRAVALLATIVRAWWLRSRRIRRLLQIVKTVKLANSHHLRGTLFRWKDRLREKRIQLAQRAKAVVREAHFLCHTIFRVWKHHVSVLLADLNLRMAAMEHDQLSDALRRWWKWGRWRRHQLVGRGTLDERRETKFLQEAFRLWCHFALMRLRERRRKRLEAFVFGQHERITCTGGLGYKLTSRVMSILRARAVTGRHLLHVFSRVQAVCNRNRQVCVLLSWAQVSTTRRYWLLTLSRVSRRRMLRLTADALFCWCCWSRHRRRFYRSNLRADNYARRQRVALFQAGLRAWRTIAVQEQQLKGTYGRVVRRWKAGGVHQSWGKWKAVFCFRKHLAYIGAKIERYRHVRLIDVFFEGWYERGRSRMRALGRLCKAISWSNVRSCGRICREWREGHLERRLRRIHQVRIAERGLQRRLAAACSHWRALHTSSKDLDRGVTRCMVSQCFRLRSAVWRGWSAATISTRDIQKACGVVTRTIAGVRESRALHAWSVHTRCKIDLRNTSAKLKLGHELRREISLYADFFDALEKAVRTRKACEMRAEQDTLVAGIEAFKDHAAQAFRRIGLKRCAAKLCQRWVRFQARQRHLHWHIESSTARRCLSICFRAWYWFCLQQNGKCHVSRIVVNGYVSTQLRAQHAAFDGWLHKTNRTKTAEMMRARVIVRLVENIERRALLTWRAHTRGTLAVETRPLELLIAMQRKRHCRTILALALGVLRDRKARRARCHMVYAAHHSRAIARLRCFSLHHWRLWSSFSARVASFFIFELGMRRIARVTRGWVGVVQARERLAFVVVKNRRRFLAMVLKKWRALLLRQDRVLDSFHHRFHHQQMKAAAHVLSCWSLEAASRQRKQALQLRFLHAYRRGLYLAVARAWRGHVLRCRHYAGLLLDLQGRRRRTTLRRCLIVLRISHKLRQAIRLVVGYMAASRRRRLVARALHAWSWHCAHAKAMLTAAVRIIGNQQRRLLYFGLDLWTEAVRVHQKGQAELRQEEAIHQALEARDHGLAEVAKQLQSEREKVENIGREIDKKDLRIRSLQEMMEAYENEFKNMQEARERDTRLRDKTTAAARVLEPRLQMSSRSARSCEKENEGPLGV